MKVRVRMSVMSNLSDAQHLMDFNPKKASDLINYCKACLIKYDDLDEYVDAEELNSLYREVANELNSK